MIEASTSGTVARRAATRLLAALVVCVVALGLAGCEAPTVVLSGRLDIEAGIDAGQEVAVFAADAEVLVARTFTDGEGDYSFDSYALDDGTYRIRFTDGDKWWQGSATWAAAAAVPVSVASPVTINATYRSAAHGTVSGTITSATSDPRNARVEAINAETGVVLDEFPASSTGTWSVNLAPGPYRFRATRDPGPGGREGLTTRYNGSVASAALAPIVQVTGGVTVTGVTMHLDIESRITGRVTDGSEGLPGAKVFAIDTHNEISAPAVTDSTGAFSIRGLDTIGYRLVAADDQLRFRNLVWGATDAGSGTVFSPPPASTLAAGTLVVRAWDCVAGTFEPGANLAGVDLDAARLMRCDLTGANLSGASLVSANLANATLTGADLSGADLTGANLTNATLTNANLSGANLTGSQLRGVISGGIVGVPSALPAGWSLVAGTLTYTPIPAPLTWANAAPISYGTPLGAAQLNATSTVPGTFTYTPAAGTVLALGTHTLSVTFTPNDLATWAPSTRSVGLTVNTAATTTVLTATGDGNPATLTATVSAAAGTPTGSVEFRKGATPLGTSPLDAGGKATLTVTLPAGSQSLSAVYSGGPSYLGSTSAPLTLVVPDHCSSPGQPGVDWSGCNLGSRNLTGANLVGANLSGTNLGGATLTNVSSGQIVGVPAALPAGWSLRGGYLVGPGADLDGADLSFVELDDANLQGASVVGATLKGVSFWRVNAVGTNFTGTNFLYADIRYSNLTDAVLTNANLDRTYVLYNNLTGVVSGGLTGTWDHFAMSDGSTWRIIGGWLISPATVISNLTFPQSLVGANFSGFNVANTNFSGKDLTGAGFSASEITNANFSGATLTGVSSGGIIGTPAALPTGWHLKAGHLAGPGANLTSADFTSVNLSGLDLTGANLTSAKLTNANLTGVNLAGTTLAGVLSGGIVGTPSALPAGWALSNGYLFGPGVNLAGATLVGANLAGVNLTSANFTGANLTNVNFTGANLTTATFTNATVTGANLSAATMTGVVTGGLVGNPAVLPTGWVLRGGFLVGPGANLAGKDLSGVNLAGVNLIGANLTGANLTGANLTGADLSTSNLTNADVSSANLSGAVLAGTTVAGLRSGGIVGTPASLPPGWTLVGGFLIGAGANLGGENLVGVDLTALDLGGVNLSGADLTGVDLQGKSLVNTALTAAILVNANLDGVDLSFVELDDANLQGASVVGATLKGVSFWRVNAVGTNFTGTNFLYADIRYSTFTNAVITNANLDRTYVLYNTFSGVVSGGVTGSIDHFAMGDGSAWRLAGGYWIGHHVNLTGANLTGLDLTGVDVSYANLTGAVLNSTTITNANVTGTNFTGATLTSVTSGGLVGTPAVLPPGYQLIGGTFVAG